MIWTCTVSCFNMILFNSAYWIATVLSTVDVLLKTRMGVNGKERSTSIYVKSGEKNKALYFLGL
jgi:hypothetical protein